MSNVQFVESRVYEGDEDTLEDLKAENSDKQEEASELKEAKFHAEIGAALAAGANFVETAFDKVVVSN